MREGIFFPVMIISLSFGRYFAPYLVDKIKEFKTPEDITITDAKHGINDALTFIFEQVKKRNYTPGEEEVCVEYEADNFIYIEFESESSLRYQRLSWLEEQIKEVVKVNDESVALYFFALMKDLTFFEMDFAKVITSNNIKFYDDEYDENFSDIISYGPFLNHWWYLNEDKSIIEAFPDLTAKFLLLLG